MMKTSEYTAEQMDADEVNARSIAEAHKLALAAGYEDQVARLLEAYETVIARLGYDPLA